MVVSPRSSGSIDRALSPLNPRVNPAIDANGERQEPASRASLAQARNRSPASRREQEDEEASARALVVARTLTNHTRAVQSPGAAAKERLSSAWPERQAGLNAMGFVALFPSASYLEFVRPQEAMRTSAEALAPRPLQAAFSPVTVGRRARAAAAHPPLQRGRDGRDAASAQRYLSAIERERVVATYDLLLPQAKTALPAIEPLIECFPHAPRTQEEEGVIGRWQKRNMALMSHMLFKDSQQIIRRTARRNMQKFGLLPRFVTLGDAEVLTQHPFDVQAYRARKLAAQSEMTTATAATARKRQVVRVYADTPENRAFMRGENEFLAAYTMATFHLDEGRRLAAAAPLSLMAFPGVADR